jgi:hypothetical protein
MMQLSKGRLTDSDIRFFTKFGIQIYDNKGNELYKSYSDLLNKNWELIKRVICNIIK